jgi:hypothetical protein
MLIDVLVTPVSVAPVACPWPHGEARVPNEVFEMEDRTDAPDTEAGTTTPAAVSAESNSASPTARMPVILFMVDPPVW